MSSHDQLFESITESVSNAAKQGIKDKYNIKDSDISAVKEFINSNPDLKAKLDNCKTSSDVAKVMRSKEFKKSLSKDPSNNDKKDKKNVLDKIEQMSKITLFIVMIVWYCKGMIMQGKLKDIYKHESADLLTEAGKSYKKDKYGNWLTGKSFKGVPITVHCYKGKPTEEELVEMLTNASFDKALSIMNKKESVDLLYTEVAKAVNEYAKNCLEGRKDQDSAYYKLCKQYVDSVEYCKSSLKLDVVKFVEFKNQPEFDFVFDSEISSRDGHSIFVEGCNINLESKTVSVKSHNISFEG